MLTTLSPTDALLVRVGVRVGIHACGPTYISNKVIGTGAVARRAGMELEVVTTNWRHIRSPHP